MAHLDMEQVCEETCLPLKRVNCIYVCICDRLQMGLDREGGVDTPPPTPGVHNIPLPPPGLRGEHCVCVYQSRQLADISAAELKNVDERREQGTNFWFQIYKEKLF